MRDSTEYCSHRTLGPLLKVCADLLQEWNKAFCTGIFKFNQSFYWFNSFSEWVYLLHGWLDFLLLAIKIQIFFLLYIENWNYLNSVIWVFTFSCQFLQPWGTLILLLVRLNKLDSTKYKPQVPKIIDIMELIHLIFWGFKKSVRLKSIVNLIINIRSDFI